MSKTKPSAHSHAHHVSRMSGRDPHQGHRAATPLELLFDLTFVIAFGLAASQLAHLLAEGHFNAGLIGFGFASFSICWAWVNFSWFASAYDTDDWVFRIVTMVQMVGVLILAVGLPPMFDSIDKGEHLNNSIMVLGYVVMRVAMVFQWLRAAHQDPLRRRACMTYAAAIAIAQLGWTVLIFLDFSLLTTFVFVVAFTAAVGATVAARHCTRGPLGARRAARRSSARDRPDGRRRRPSSLSAPRMSCRNSRGSVD
ncbi:low temperature requirement protein A [Sinorhizobium fredii]|uniref:low temperature requirement protein A n=1 Tax=Rhizobium fredii TaxID=380 RepID=UPI0004B9CED6|nr:low temperature requirement protein A [Sinorhizobium fredii]